MPYYIKSFSPGAAGTIFGYDSTAAACNAGKAAAVHDVLDSACSLKLTAPAVGQSASCTICHKTTGALPDRDAAVVTVQNAQAIITTTVDHKDGYDHAGAASNDEKICSRFCIVLFQIADGDKTQIEPS